MNDSHKCLSALSSSVPMEKIDGICTAFSFPAIFSKPKVQI